jgi:hypothetical protein
MQDDVRQHRQHHVLFRKVDDNLYGIGNELAHDVSPVPQLKIAPMGDGSESRRVQAVRLHCPPYPPSSLFPLPRLTATCRYAYRFCLSYTQVPNEFGKMLKRRTGFTGSLINQPNCEPVSYQRPLIVTD